MEHSDFDALKLENQLCFPLYAASREVIKRYRPLLSALDLTYTQYIAMMVLWEVRSISAKELGQKLFLDSGTLTPVLKSLEAKGLIERSRFSKDERVLLVTVTPKGEELKQQARSVPGQLVQCIPLDSSEALQLYQLLYKILGTRQEP